MGYLDNTGLAYFWNKISTKKQEKLVSGTNIKTICGKSLLGSGNLTGSIGENSVIATKSNATISSDNTIYTANSLCSMTLTVNIYSFSSEYASYTIYHYRNGSVFESISSKNMPSNGTVNFTLMSNDRIVIVESACGVRYSYTVTQTQIAFS